MKTFYISCRSNIIKLKAILEMFYLLLCFHVRKVRPPQKVRRVIRPKDINRVNELGLNIGPWLPGNSSDNTKYELTAEQWEPDSRCWRRSVGGNSTGWGSEKRRQRRGRAPARLRRSQVVSGRDREGHFGIFPVDLVTSWEQHERRQRGRKSSEMSQGLSSYGKE